MANPPQQAFTILEFVEHLSRAIAQEPPGSSSSSSGCDGSCT